METKQSAVKQASEVFANFYQSPNSEWGGHSGPGSDPYSTIEYRAFLEKFIRMNNIKSVVDIGCGDWQFSKYLNLDGIRYYGFDVVEKVVEINSQRYGSATVSFAITPEKLEDLPAADLVIMKDVLQHLPDRTINEFKRLVFDRYPRSLITNSYIKHNAVANHDIAMGGFRCLDLTVAPYHFKGTYVLEISSLAWERIRTLLYIPQSA